MGVSEEDRGDYRLLVVRGFLDGHTEESRQLEELLTRTAEDRDDRPLVLDLSGAIYMNSAMIGRLVQWYLAVTESARRGVLLAPAAGIRTVLEMTGLSHVLPIAGGAAELPACLAGEGPSLPAATAVDAEALTGEIERTMTSGEPPADGGRSQIGRLLGG